MYESPLLTQEWRHNATTDVYGMSRRNEEHLSFRVRQARQFLDVASPSNLVYTNPDVPHETVGQGKRNLVQGFRNFIDDCQRKPRGEPPGPVKMFAGSGIDHLIG